MKFKVKEIKIERVDDKKVVSKFLLFPKTLPVKENSKFEQTRWLEVCDIIQECHSCFNEPVWDDLCWYSS